MSAQLFEQPLAVGKKDSYTLTVSSSWLGAEVITTSLVESTGVTIESFSFAGNVIEFYATGVTIGRKSVQISFDTATRSRCYTGLLEVVSC
jgi:hypothetical protein